MSILAALNKPPQSTGLSIRAIQAIIILLVLLAVLESVLPFKDAVYPKQSEPIALESGTATPGAFSIMDNDIDYAALTEKPLFTVNRQPYPFPIQTTETPLESPLELTQVNPQTASREERPTQATSNTRFVLEGIIYSPDMQIAFIRPQNGSVSIRVKTNEDIEGWTIKAINQREVLLTRNAQEQRLFLDEDDVQE